MNAKHTPGPWSWIKNRTSYRNLISENGEDVLLADEYAGSTWIEVSETNARLIAAAPELLEALLKYELPINTENIDLSRIEFGSEAVERELQRRAAIAKATGEEQ